MRTVTMPGMHLVGIDPGLSLTGFACVRVCAEQPLSQPELVEAGVFRLDRRRSVSERLVELERDVCDLLGRVRPVCVCVESLFSHVAHPRTSVIMGHARGVILLAVARSGIELIELPPAEVKKAVTGNGRASKPQVQQAVVTQLGLASVPEPPDVADAIAAALCGSRRWAASVLSAGTPGRAPAEALHSASFPR
ncbi:MAG: crossover junction endodeoxyribonuclease RuvC [Planctomycetota bacterium]|nr:crossover junction endodeoxyribonuclease RuvC [Planctomycetota bacterium]